MVVTPLQLPQQLHPSHSKRAHLGANHSAFQKWKVASICFFFFCSLSLLLCLFVCLFVVVFDGMELDYRFLFSDDLLSIHPDLVVDVSRLERKTRERERANEGRSRACMRVCVCLLDAFLTPFC